ncbi:Reverse transcriptase zinc-binding domain [Macleaya cordata]|uniref:Reverse transcriptase zinc-binding domain n=1 Tax=Macleaya cordata TaxID=56857 RepID=A0A200PMX9_MACCD|nr:Reverse transcriptase zinc-binding domain [Macleaya cordata]
MGFCLVSKCYMCGKEEESLDHLIWKCEFAEEGWSWIHSIFGHARSYSIEDILRAAKHQSQAIKEVWTIGELSPAQQVVHGTG